MSGLLLDTCAVIWLAAGTALGREAQQALIEAHEAGKPITMSPITAWEIGVLHASGRIALTADPQKWMTTFCERTGFRWAEMSPDLLIASSSLPGNINKDPADRIIAATAREFSFTVVTREHNLIEYGQQGYINICDCRDA